MINEPRDLALRYLDLDEIRRAKSDAISYTNCSVSLWWNLVGQLQPGTKVFLSFSPLAKLEPPLAPDRVRMYSDVYGIKTTQKKVSAVGWAET